MTFGSCPSCAFAGNTSAVTIHNVSKNRMPIRFIEASSPWLSSARELFRPAAMHRHIDPMAVGILDAMIGILVRFGIDLGVKPGFLQSSFDVVEIVDFETEMIDSLFLLVAFDLDESDIHIAVCHVN